MSSVALDFRRQETGIEFEMSASFALSCLGARPARVLDVGCGPGQISRLVMAGRHEVIGIDPDADDAAAARERGVQVEECGLQEFEGEGFDAVLFMRSLHHMHDLNGALEKAVRSLKPGGQLIVEEKAFCDPGAHEAGAWLASMGALACEMTGLAPRDGHFLKDILEADDPCAHWLSVIDDSHTAATMEAALAEKGRMDVSLETPFIFRYFRALDDGGAAQRAVFGAEHDAITRGEIPAVGRQWRVFI